MTIWTEVDRARTAAGDEILLRQRGEIHEIRFNGIELMSNLTWRSEEVLAIRSLRKRGLADARVLIGGLGMGFTLRAALDHLDGSAAITVCELVPEIAGWNRGILGPLAGKPLEDRRVTLCVDDVMDILDTSPAGFDVILMDTDNGPDFTVRDENAQLYAHSGLARLHRALRPGGIAAFWSAEISAPFEVRLDALGWQWSREDILLPQGRADAFHHVYYMQSPSG